MTRTVDYASRSQEAKRERLSVRVRLIGWGLAGACVMHTIALSFACLAGWTMRHRCWYTLGPGVSLDPVSSLAFHWQKLAHLRETIWLLASLLASLVTIAIAGYPGRAHRAIKRCFFICFAVALLGELVSLGILLPQLPIQFCPYLRPRKVLSFYPEYEATALFAASGVLAVLAIGMHRRRYRSRGEEASLAE